MTVVNPVENGPEAAAGKRVWDLPIRLTHWLLVILVGCSWWTAENDRLDWHTWSGYGILTLLLFRIYWGFFGSTTARFRHFIQGPRAVWAHARELFSRPGKPTLGHNPMGGWSILALLALMASQVGLGLFAEDVDGLASGPLSYMVSYETARWAAETHEAVFELLLVFIVLHIAAILFYWVYKRNNLIPAMFTGRAQLADKTPVYMAPLWRAAVGLVASILMVWWLVG